MTDDERFGVATTMKGIALGMFVSGIVILLCWAFLAGCAGSLTMSTPWGDVTGGYEMKQTIIPEPEPTKKPQARLPTVDRVNSMIAGAYDPRTPTE